jgi:hypothetical protein
MDEIAKATVAAILSKINSLEMARLGPEYSYHSLPLCVINAVFSIGVRYRNVQNVVQSWCVAQRPKYSTGAQARETITDLIRATNGYEGIPLAQRFFGGNRQRTSSRSGILKADAVIRFAKDSKNPAWTISPISGMLLALSAHGKLSVPSLGKKVVFRSIIY